MTKPGWPSLAAIGLAGLLASTLHGQQPAARTTNDRIFTDEQAKRGGVLYRERCAMCHGEELSGVEMAPPLAGPMFQGDWNAATLGELFERIRVSMPMDKPGTLSRQQAVDLVAFILSANKAPTGPNDLPPEIEILNAIKLEVPRPSSQ